MILEESESLEPKCAVQSLFIALVRMCATQFIRIFLKKNELHVTQLLERFI